MERVKYDTSSIFDVIVCSKPNLLVVIPRQCQIAVSTVNIMRKQRRLARLRWSPECDTRLPVPGVTHFGNSRIAIANAHDRVQTRRRNRPFRRTLHPMFPIPINDSVHKTLQIDTRRIPSRATLPRGKKSGTPLVVQVKCAAQSILNKCGASSKPCLNRGTGKSPNKNTI